MPSALPTLLLLAVPLAAALSAGLIVRLRPLLQRYALARPNARSSHTVPTPQGGGIAVVAAPGRSRACSSRPRRSAAGRTGPGVAAPLALALVGAVDDIRPLPAALRLVVQAASVGGWSGRRRRAAAARRCRSRLERGLALLAGVWFVNLVNFMDGLDWMTVAEIVPVAGALAAARRSPAPRRRCRALVAAGLLGAMLGFAPFNRPVARLFLGDVGSLPIGLVIAWLLYRLAAGGRPRGGAPAAALPTSPTPP